MRLVPCAQLGERLDGRGRSERREPRVEVALHSVLQIDRTVVVLAFCVVGARADSPEQKILLRILRGDAGDVGGIEDNRALLLQYGKRVFHHLQLIGVETAAETFRSRHGDALVK